MLVGVIMLNGNFVYAADQTDSKTIDNGTSVTVAGCEVTGNDNVKNSTLTVTGGTIGSSVELYGAKRKTAA